MPPPFRVVLFSASSHQRPAFQAEAQHHPHLHLVYISARLTASTAGLAANAAVVSLDAADDTSPQLLRQLKQLGVQLVALRYARVPLADLLNVLKSGLRLATIPSHAATSVAEYAVTLILSLHRKVHLAARRVRDGNMTLTGLVGGELRGKTVGIVGTDAVGRAVARIMVAFGCQVLAFDVARRGDVAAAGVAYVPLETLLARSDVISLHAPLVHSTLDLIGARSLRLCKRGVCVVNTSRGRLVNLGDAVRALQSGLMGGFAMDVAEEQANEMVREPGGGRGDPNVDVLAGMPNVIITVRQATMTTNAMAFVARATVRTFSQFFLGQAVEYEVQAPAASAPR